MFSMEECKKQLKGNNYTDAEIEEIKETLYALADIAVTEFITKRTPTINQNVNISNDK